jgi:hypothetical protein
MKSAERDRLARVPGREPVLARALVRVPALAAD